RRDALTERGRRSDERAVLVGGELGIFAPLAFPEVAHGVTLAPGAGTARRCRRRTPQRSVGRALRVVLRALDAHVDVLRVPFGVPNQAVVAVLRRGELNQLLELRFRGAGRARRGVKFSLPGIVEEDVLDLFGVGERLDEVPGRHPIDVQRALGALGRAGDLRQTDVDVATALVTAMRPEPTTAAFADRAHDERPRVARFLAEPSDRVDEHFDRVRAPPRDVGITNGVDVARGQLHAGLQAPTIGRAEGQTARARVEHLEPTRRLVFAPPFDALRERRFGGIRVDGERRPGLELPRNLAVPIVEVAFAHVELLGDVLPGVAALHDV